MERNKCLKLIFLFALYTVVSLSSAPAWAAQEATPKQQAALGSADCIKCHAVQPEEVASKGAKHKTISCQDCHTGHRPASKNNIPQCNMCHQGKPHFEVKGCLGCHKNPHTPLQISFATNVTEPCLSCHSGQIQQLKEHKSKHSALGCTTCHDVHRKKPDCLQCHKPHSANMKTGDCNKCHAVHMPRNVKYASDTASLHCAACHATANKQLNASKARHSSLNCAFCHQEKHKAIPSCKDCHGDKHPQSIMAKFPKCGDCHKTAHDLNNWAPAAEPAADVKKPAAKKKKGQ